MLNSQPMLNTGYVANWKFPALNSLQKLLVLIRQCRVMLQDINEMVHTERPDWQSVMTYVTAIYKYFET